jgi:predicted DNA-binding transcriptional regulator AlpA
MPEKILISFPELYALGITLSKRRINELIEQGKFPKPIRIGGRFRSWRLQEIMEHIDARAAERDQDHVANRVVKEDA